MLQDPYLKSEEYGQTIDEVENLIKKHEAFEKAAAAQEERFAALERLTTVRYLYMSFVTQKLPQICTGNHATFPIRIRIITVQICGNLWVTQ